MATRNDTLTDEGKKFIRAVASGNGNSLLKGNSGPLPLSDDGTGKPVDKEWTANVEWIRRDELGNQTTNAQGVAVVEEITTNGQLADALISWFNFYGRVYALDPNILAAQAYIESGFKVWSYSATNTASGINRFKMLTTYSVILNNFGGGGPLILPRELVKILNGLSEELSITSYQPDDGTPATRGASKLNRPILHQNIIDNPEIMIKAQARYMRYFSETCAKLASSSLLCYHTSNEYVADTYSRTIEKFQKNNGETIVTEGLDYVLKVFGALGDVENKVANGKFGKYKPKGHSFGYDTTNEEKKTVGIFKYGGKDDLATYPNENFNIFDANVDESDEYGITKLDDLSIVSNKNYKFIYFPSDQYFQTENTGKKQIVLHHTVSGQGVNGDIAWWRSTAAHIATSMIIGHDGKIYQCF